jgi:hypothetical protein
MNLLIHWMLSFRFKICNNLNWIIISKEYQILLKKWYQMIKLDNRYVNYIKNILKEFVSYFILMVILMN